MNKGIVSKMVSSYVETRTEELRGTLYESVLEVEEADIKACAAYHALRERLRLVEPKEEVEKDPLSSLFSLLEDISHEYICRENSVAEAAYKAGMNDGYKLREGLNVPSDRIGEILGVNY